MYVNRHKVQWQRGRLREASARSALREGGVSEVLGGGIAAVYDEPFPVVVVVASAGGLRALSIVLGGLPAGFGAAVAVVQHRGTGSSVLADILANRTRLHVRDAEQQDLLRPGIIYLAPVDRHLVVTSDGSLFLSDGPKVRFVRPAGDPLFESAAACYRERVIGLVLTGGGHDGTEGVRVIKTLGGRVIVQDEATCEAPSMPRSAIATGKVDFVLPLTEVARVLVRLVQR